VRSRKGSAQIAWKRNVLGQIAEEVAAFAVRVDYMLDAMDKIEVPRVDATVTTFVKTRCNRGRWHRRDRNRARK
jgi:hypothetical protein